LGRGLGKVTNFAIQYIGGTAVETPSRLKRLAESISRRTPVKNISSQYVYVVASKQPLNENELDRVNLLLGAGDSSGRPTIDQLFVGPRFGTISPWSSKATTILINCDLDIVRIERIKAYSLELSDQKMLASVKGLLFDRMTESCFLNLNEATALFDQDPPSPYEEINVVSGGKELLDHANLTLGLALNQQEIDYLFNSYQELGKNPSDVELMMFAQANSEHCRHKVFNAQYKIDGHQKEKSLFQMIKNTYHHNPDGVLSAYSDNAAVVEGGASRHLIVNPDDSNYTLTEDVIHAVLKVETHNHPTAISPFSGAATGSGGEIRDEGATGLGARPKAGMVGYVTSHLCAFETEETWESCSPKPPSRIATPLEIMLSAPIGAASFNNEFGRPAINGFFRTYEDNQEKENWGFFKPIMIAGGVGSIRAGHSIKLQGDPGTKIYVIGGPGMLIGLGGGAASSLASGFSDEYLDFASVQRGNPEMQRRAQEVINRCTSYGESNPIISIHDVGAGGLSNAVPEIVHQSDMGAEIHLRAIPVDEPGMSPLQIWCNESQERYVLLVDPRNARLLEEHCISERCPFACIGELTAKQDLKLFDALYENYPIDIPMKLLFGNTPRMLREVSIKSADQQVLYSEDVPLSQALTQVLRFPAVSAKSFLITIGDRSVGGLVARDQFVGPWQVPVSNVGVVLRGFCADQGEAIATGEKISLANIDPRAAARMAVSETLLNLMSANIDSIESVKLSANWMASIGKDQEDYKLYEMVHEIGEVLCPKLGISIPVGKDSLSMTTRWHDNKQAFEVHSPVSLILTGLANVSDVNKTLTPQLGESNNETCLIFIDLAGGKSRLAGSCFAQAFNFTYKDCPDLDGDHLLKSFFLSLKKLKDKSLVYAYHDRSDGGLAVTMLEMAFAGRCGLDIFIPENETAIDFLFNEELGAVIEVDDSKSNEVIEEFLRNDIQAVVIGKPKQELEVNFLQNGLRDNSFSLLELYSEWTHLSYRMQALRDNLQCAKEERASSLDPSNRGLQSSVPIFKHSPKIYKGSKPKVALIREQGVNSHHEMAAALMDAKFQPIDIHMNDLLSGKKNLDQFSGLVMCGGFSYGDVLGAGGGWAGTILNNEHLKNIFKEFFYDQSRFSLGVCNGCQALSKLNAIIPGATDWPSFEINQSEQFEARVAMVRVKDSPSILFNGMSEMVLPIVVSHGEGRANVNGLVKPRNITMCYVDNDLNATQQYPFNPNGSSWGIAGLSNQDGRINIMMPHPERSYLSSQLSWHPKEWGRGSPWSLVFSNAREWLSS
jgi:phosphoribosylformylglycinamidine synthase